MTKRFALFLMISAGLTCITSPAFAQRGRVGGGGGGGMARPAGGGGGAPMQRPAMPSGGGMARPAPAQMSRPAAMPSRPANPGGGNFGGGNFGGAVRPSMPSAPAGMARPSMPNNGRPNAGMANRPNPGATTRPAPGGIPGGLPGGGMNRPTTFPGQIGGGAGQINRPSGGIASGIRPGGPSTLPGQIQNRPSPGFGGVNTLPGQIGPGGLNRPGAGGATTLPGQIGNRPGGGQIGMNRPNPGAGGPTTLPGQIGNRPGLGGGGINRPGFGGAGTLPGQIPNRPGLGGGGGNFPGAGGTGLNRPGQGGAGNLPGQIGNRPIGGNGNGLGNRPNWGSGGAGNLPGQIGNRPIGSGNNNNVIINNNNNTNINSNRPNINVGGGGFNNGNRPNGNWGNNNWNNNNNWGNRPGGNWGGNGNGNWGGNNNWGHGGGWYGGGGNVVNHNYYGPGWSGANYGNWYHGGSSGNFWAGVGTGLVASWGVNALYNPRYAYNSYGYYPSAWAAPVYGSWGLSSVSSSWMYSNYANPYITPATQTVYIQQSQPVVIAVDGTSQAPVTEQVVAYDYSKPINTSSTPPEPTAAESAQKVFESARASFKQNDYGRALSLADQSLSQLPSDPVLHEFRALCLFALKRYDEAAAVNYAVLSAGPTWDWATLINLYSGIDVYTGQLRELESYVKLKPDSAPAQFQLAYLYLAQGAKEAAARQFGVVSKLQPADALSAQLAKTLDPSEEQKQIQKAMTAESNPPQPSATPIDPAAPAATTAKPQPEKPQTAPLAPPAKMVGTWIANPDPKVKITLVLSPTGEFSWGVTQDGRTQTIQGQAGYQDEVLILSQQDGPPLAGKITFDDEKKQFGFKPPGSPDDVPGLSFALEPSHN